MIDETGGNEWLVLHLAIVVLPVVNVLVSATWTPPAKAGWIAAILCFSLFAYAAFLFVTANKVNRRELEVVRAATPAGRTSTLFVVGRWISTFGRRGAVAIAMGIVVWVVIHLVDPDWMRQSYWIWYFPVLFMYWLPVEFLGQLLMAVGRKRRPASASS